MHSPAATAPVRGATREPLHRCRQHSMSCVRGPRCREGAPAFGSPAPRATAEKSCPASVSTGETATATSRRRVRCAQITHGRPAADLSAHHTPPLTAAARHVEPMNASNEHRWDDAGLCLAPGRKLAWCVSMDKDMTCRGFSSDIRAERRVDFLQRPLNNVTDR